MTMTKNKKYESDLDQFLDSLKTPEEREKASMLRATWWDKSSKKVNEDKVKTNEVPRGRYLYY